MPKAPWRRRRATDSPRPAGRRWAGRLRRSGSLARQVLLAGRVGRRRGDGNVTRATSVFLPADPDALSPGSARRPRLRMRRRDGAPLDASALAPISPAGPAPAAPRLRGAEFPQQPPPLSIPLLPGERTFSRRMRFMLVQACTVGSLVLGISAIFLAINRVDVRLAAGLLIACVAFDGLDGALARRLGVASPFGAQMDSLADMCSFGLAAPVVVYAWLAGSAPSLLIVPACALVAVCAAIRLARFNVSPKDGRFFCGVPTTMCAAVLALGTLISPEVSPALRIVGVALLGLAMVSSFPYAKLARLLRLPPWLLVLPVIGALIDYRSTFVAVVVAYLCSGPLLWLLHRQRVAA